MSTARKFPGLKPVQKILEHPNGDEDLVEVIYPTDGIRFRLYNETLNGKSRGRWNKLGCNLFLRDLPEEDVQCQG